MPSPRAAKKSEVVAFKVDGELLTALERIPNRSEFIRNALLSALSGSCPLCGGTGTLSVRQREHWQRFARHHVVEKCSDCHEPRLVCKRSTK